MSQDHYLPLFVGDFLASTATWTGPERGLYVQLLMTAWASGPLPCDLDRLALVLHYEPKEFRKLWPVMACKFQNGDGRLTNVRLEAVRTKNTKLHAARSAQATAASNARWNAPSIPPASNEQSPSNAWEMPSDPIRSDLDQNINPKKVNASAEGGARGISETVKRLAEAKRMTR